MDINLTIIWQRLTADRKRFGLLCSLLAAGLLLWARIIVIERPPRTAVADTDAALVEKSESSSDNNKTIIVLDSIPTTNPFTLHAEVFPLPIVETDNTPDYQVITSKTEEEEAAADLVLNAVMDELAMIGGTVYSVGDIVARQGYPEPLILVEVVGRSVILLAGDRRYELTIASHRP